MCVGIGDCGEKAGARLCGRDARSQRFELIDGVQVVGECLVPLPLRLGQTGPTQPGQRLKIGILTLLMDA